MLLLLAFVLGMTAGLRSLTPVAVVAWAAQSRWPGLRLSPLAFMGAPITAWIATALACLELITDKLPFTPSRLAPPALTARVLMGVLCGAVLCAAGGESLALGGIVGAVGAVAGAYAGYHVRHALVANLKVPDIVIAVAEDLVTIGTAFLVVSQV